MQFTLISEHQRPVAAILDSTPTLAERKTVYELLPRDAHIDTLLAQRWGVAEVLSPPAWAQEQFHRRPMLKPRGATLSILSDS